MIPPRQATVLLADDQVGIRVSLRNLLQDEGLVVVGEAADGVEAVALARELAPDVVVMDLRIPKLNGIQATREIKRLHPATQVVIFTAYDDPGLARGPCTPAPSPTSSRAARRPRSSASCCGRPAEPPAQPYGSANTAMTRYCMTAAATTSRWKISW